MAKRHIATGRIIAVQEERFRMVTDTGEGLLLTLHNLARLPAHLSDLEHTRVPVRVEYEGESNLSTGVARRIDYL